MKKYILLSILSAVITYMPAQTTITLKKDPSGIKYINCKINGAPMKMVFDTGASAVSISKSTALYLYNNDLINDGDFVGNVKTTVADGSIVDNMLINLKDVEIAGLHLKNIEAVVTSALDAPLLLGQSAISKLGKITIDGDMLTIHSASSNHLSQEQRIEIDNKLNTLRNSKPFNADLAYKVLELINRIEKSEELNEYELYSKLLAESCLNKFDEVLIDSKKWIDKYSMDTDSVRMKMYTFLVYAESNILSDKGNKEIGLQYLEICHQTIPNVTPQLNDKFWVLYPDLVHKYCEYKKEGYNMSIVAIKEAINYYMKKDGVSLNEINENKTIHKYLKYLFACLSIFYYDNCLWFNQNNNYEYTDYQFKIIKLYFIVSAKLNNDVAIDFCNENRINYKKKLTSKELNLLQLNTN